MNSNLKQLLISGLVAIISVLVFCGNLAWSTNKHISFTKGCSENLQLAAYTDDLEMAYNYLDRAIFYLEKNNLTKGCTTFNYYPSEDIGVWYARLKDTRDRLQDLIGSNLSMFEKNNILMRVREICLISPPQNIEYYPHVPFFIIGMAFTIFSIPSLFVSLTEFVYAFSDWLDTKGG